MSLLDSASPLEQLAKQQDGSSPLLVVGVAPYTSQDRFSLTWTALDEADERQGQMELSVGGSRFECKPILSQEAAGSCYQVTGSCSGSLHSQLRAERDADLLGSLSQVSPTPKGSFASSSRSLRLPRSPLPPRRPPRQSLSSRSSPLCRAKTSPSVPSPRMPASSRL